MSHHHAPRPATPPIGSDHTSKTAKPGRLRAWWSSFVGAIGAVVGLAPHLLHHIGPLAGTALIAGAGGTALFGALGLLASIPLLLGLRRRYASWWAPTIALAVFAAMFSLSAFVLGPIVSGDGDPPSNQPAPSSTEHSEHHAN
ncbi:hypothetical protein [Actinoplanes sp. NPDC049802]|uniref:hypothetical protein n=1 Tax=Actinoplanes sp. NPDC049802 TaxID=3154742 RepID=UPI0033D74DF6